MKNKEKDKKRTNKKKYIYIYIIYYMYKKLNGAKGEGWVELAEYRLRHGDFGIWTQKGRL